jgi:hypothetical protein
VAGGGETSEAPRSLAPNPALLSLWSSRSRARRGAPYRVLVAENANNPDAESKSYRERVDPGGELEKKANDLARLANSRLGRVLLRTTPETREQATKLAHDIEHLASEPERIATALSPLGWIYHGLAHLEAYGEAATLVEQGKPEEAEEFLAKTYNEEDHAFIRFYNRIFSLYQGDEQRHAIGSERRRLLDEAYELHKEGRYAAAIPLVLAQIDGIFIDMTEKPAKYFYNPKNPNLVDEVTLAGHPLGLKALSELMSREQRKTVVSDELTRQGILHGRVLGYDTLRNSTKVWAGLLAVIEAMQPRAAELNKKAAEEHERRYAGSKEIDEWGMRLDRRGFDEAKFLLQDVHLYQHGYFERHGRFAPDRKRLDPHGKLLRAGELEIRLSNGGFYALVPTPTGVIFGIAEPDNDYNNFWAYVGEEPPRGSIDEDDRWKHITDPDISPDW